MRRKKVVVASHVVHTRFDVLALLSENYEVTYFSHTLYRNRFWSIFNVISSTFRNNRNFAGLERAHGSALVLPEVVFKILKRFYSHQVAYKNYALMFDFKVSRKVKTADIFHWYAGFGERTAIKLKASGAKLICHRRGLAPETEIRIMQAVDAKYKYPDELILKRLNNEFDLADVILVNSKLTAKSFPTMYWNKIRVLYNCIDTDYYEFEKKIVFEGIQKIGFVGSLDSRKGLDVLTKAMSYINFNFEIHIVGSLNGVELDSDSYIDSRIHFHGSLSRHDLKKFYKKMSVTVLPSYSDAYGLVVAESISSGTPAIASNACGISELLPPQYVFEAGDPNSLAVALNNLFSSSEVYLSECQGLSELLQAFGFSKYSRDLKKIYKELS